MRLRNALVLTGGMLACGVAAHAYTVLGPKWGAQQVPYYVNPASSDMSETDVLAAIQAGASAWASQSSANIAPVYSGQTTVTSVSLNGRNEVFLREQSTGMYGETYWWADFSNRLVEADIIFYAGGYLFFKDTAACSGTGVYLLDAATHEFGHVLGMGHSSVSGATMYPSMALCSTYVRSLDTDDIAGIRSLYPPILTAPGPPTNVKIVR
jgi:Matrixin